MHVFNHKEIFMERARVAGDAAVLGTVVANIMEWLPAALTIVSGTLSIIWLMLRIYQTWREIKRTP